MEPRDTCVYVCGCEHLKSSRDLRLCSCVTMIVNKCIILSIQYIWLRWSDNIYTLLFADLCSEKEEREDGQVDSVSANPLDAR